MLLKRGANAIAGVAESLPAKIKYDTMRINLRENLKIARQQWHYNLRQM